MKFLQKISCTPVYNNLVLPNLWLKKLFKIPTVPDRNPYFFNFFENTLHILDCKFKLPRIASYRGHPFYYKILKTYENLIDKKCSEIQNIISMPIWFNRTLKTKFDPEISAAGFNYVKDLFPENKPLTFFYGLRNTKIRKLKNVMDKIPQSWQEKILNSDSSFITVIPHQIVNLRGRDSFLKNTSSHQIYQELISTKTNHLQVYDAG